MGIGEAQTLFCQSIEDGSRDSAFAVEGSHIAVAHVVTEDDQDVGTVVRGGCDVAAQGERQAKTGGEPTRTAGENNTTEGKQAIQESLSIRAEAVRRNVTYYTTLGAAVATCTALKHLNDSDVNRLQDLHKEVAA